MKRWLGKLLCKLTLHAWEVRAVKMDDVAWPPSSWWFCRRCNARRGYYRGIDGRLYLEG